MTSNVQPAICTRSSPADPAGRLRRPRGFAATPRTDDRPRSRRAHQAAGDVIRMHRIAVIAIPDASAQRPGARRPDQKHQRHDIGDPGREDESATPPAPQSTCCRSATAESAGVVANRDLDGGLARPGRGARQQNAATFARAIRNTAVAASCRASRRAASAGRLGVWPVWRSPRWLRCPADAVDRRTPWLTRRD